jgi:hypothetical protein
MRYGEKVPLVVWITEAPFGWSDALGNLNQKARVASAIMTAPPSEAFWSAASAVQWIDMTRVYVVGGAGAPPGATWIVSNARIPPDRYEHRNNTLLVSPTIVESFAAAWIAQQLKDRNGRR